MKNKIFWFLLCLLVSIGCGQLSSLQTAKVIGKENTSIGASAMGYALTEESTGGGELGSGVFPQVEIFGRYGISDNIDMGLKLSTGLNVLLDAKFQFIGNENSAFAMAIGAGFEYQFTRLSESTRVYRFHIPLYLSYHPRDDFAIYATPRFAIQKVTDDNDSYFPGSSLGLSYDFSERFTGMLEGSYYSVSTQNVNDNNTPLILFGIGGKYKFD